MGNDPFTVEEFLEAAYKIKERGGRLNKRMVSYEEYKFLEKLERDKMETQITSENEMQPEAVPGVGEWQSKLAELLQHNQKMVGDAFLYSKKRRDVSARALQAGFVAIDALRENSRLLVTYFKDHDTREAYAKDLYERLVK